MSPLLSVEAAARLLGISPWTVRKYVAVGRINPTRIGRRVLIAETELAKFVQSCQPTELRERESAA